MIRPWSEIRSFYKKLADAGLRVQSMAVLVEQIEASNYANGLHGWTSMHDLCIAQTPGSPQCGPYLRMAPLFDGKIEFRYIDTYRAERQWHRIVKEDEAFSRLERFFDQLRWFASIDQPRPPLRGRSATRQR